MNRYHWLLRVMKIYELEYYERCATYRDPSLYLLWLAEGRYRLLNPKYRKRHLLLLCP